MKTIKILALLAVVLTGMVSCRKEDATVPERHRIVFGGSMVIDGERGETKGLDPIDSKEKVQKMRIYASFDENEFGGNSEIGNYFWNAEAERKESTEIFETTEEFFWPISGKLSFFAVTPSDAEVVCNPEHKGEMHLTVTPSANIAAQKDICYATPVLDQSRSDKPIGFTFHHCMTNIFFSANYIDNGGMIAEKGFKVKVDSVILKGIKGSRELTVKSDGSASWTDRSPAPEKVEYVLTREGNFLSQENIVSDTEGFTSITSLNGRLYLIPQQLEGAKLIVVYSFVESSAGKEEVISSFHVENDLPTNPAWEPSKSINYKLSFDLQGLTELKIDAESGKWIENWTQGATHEYDIL